jgi:hypothetical protein
MKPRPRYPISDFICTPLARAITPPLMAAAEFADCWNGNAPTRTLHPYIRFIQRHISR